jgi:hypothetical protein
VLCQISFIGPPVEISVEIKHLGAATRFIVHQSQTLAGERPTSTYSNEAQ